MAAWVVSDFTPRTRTATATQAQDSRENARRGGETEQPPHLRDPDRRPSKGRRRSFTETSSLLPQDKAAPGREVSPEPQFLRWEKRTQGRQSPLPASPTPPAACGLPCGSPFSHVTRGNPGEWSSATGSLAWRRASHTGVLAVVEA